MKLTILFPAAAEYRSLAAACQSTPPPEGSHLRRSKPSEKRLKKSFLGHCVGPRPVTNEPSRPFRLNRMCGGINSPGDSFKLRTEQKIPSLASLAYPT